MAHPGDGINFHKDMSHYDRWLVWHDASRLLRWSAGSAKRRREPIEWGNQALLEKSLALVAPVALDLVNYFYRQLFSSYPYLRRFFPSDMSGQSDRLLAALIALVNGIDEPAALIGVLEQLGRDHRKFGVRPVHFMAVGKTLIGSLRHYAGPAWTAEVEEAWLMRYQAASAIMIAAAEDAADTPPYWYATVTEHRLVNPNVALITLHPHLPYPYEFGQEATIESPHLPRVWRRFAMHSAARADGHLLFEVRATGLDQLTDVLIRHTKPGDQLRLGAPLDPAEVEHGA